MKLLVLSTEEAVLLSSICPQKTTVKSPMQSLYLLSQFAFRQEAFTKSVPKFLDEDVLLIDREEKLHLTQELLPVFWTLNAPQEVFTLSRKSSADIREIAWCRNGNLWVQQATSIDQEVEFIAYPYDEEGLQAWFGNDFISDLQFNPEQSEKFPDVFKELSIHAVSFLLAIQMVYRIRFDKGQELAEEDLMVGLDDISDLMTSGGFDATKESLTMGNKFVELVSSGKDELLPAIDELIMKGFLESKEEKYLFSSTSKALFDPGRIQEMILYKYLDEQIILKTVTVLDGGYLILEHPSAEDEEKVFIRAIPGDHDKDELLYALRNVLFGLPPPAPPEEIPDDELPPPPPPDA